jgi:predicted DNA-binding protein (UPF0251 family)/predicted Fe-Mo cluster-binding NifX family protein
VENDLSPKIILDSATAFHYLNCERKPTTKEIILARPSKCRVVGAAPATTFFKPRGVPMQELTEVYLSMDGFEAMRLTDIEGLKQEEAAEKMGVSRQTFGRILAAARKTVTSSLFYAMALRVDGGNVELKETKSSGGDTAASASIKQQNEAACLYEGPPPDPEWDQKELDMNDIDKIAVTSDGPDLDGPLDPRFGRAAGFMIVNPETFEFTYLDNGSSQAMAQGAGIQAAENVAASGAKVVLTGYVGPKAFQALSAAKIHVIQNLENLTIRQAVERFSKGDLSPASQPNKRGHWK